MNSHEEQKRVAWESAGNEPSNEGEERKGVKPPLYCCRHKAQASGCKLWYMHPEDPFPCNGPVNASTPCPICSCTGCLQKVN